MGKPKTTTISLHLDTKILLLKIGGEFAVKDGKTYSYNDTIQGLIEEHEKKK